MGREEIKAYLNAIQKLCPEMTKAVQVHFEPALSIRFCWANRVVGKEQKRIRLRTTNSGTFFCNIIETDTEVNRPK